MTGPDRVTESGRESGVVALLERAADCGDPRVMTPESVFLAPADLVALRALAQACRGVPADVLREATDLSEHTAHYRGDDWRALAALLRALAGGAA